MALMPIFCGRSDMMEAVRGEKVVMSLITEAIQGVELVNKLLSGASSQDLIFRVTRQFIADGKGPTRAI
jgi:aconitase A